MAAGDGVILMTDVYTPVPKTADEQFPALVLRTPYSKRMRASIGFPEVDFFPKRGYIVVVQDSRGRFASAGDFKPLFTEADDGYDCVEWAAQLPLCNGKVGACGQSYMGAAQYLMMLRQPPSLVACSVTSGLASCYNNFMYRRGVLELKWVLMYFAYLARDTARRKQPTSLYKRFLKKVDGLLKHPGWYRFGVGSLLERMYDIQPISEMKDEAVKTLPIASWADTLRAGAPFMEDLLKHSTDDGFWDEIDCFRSLPAENHVACLHIGSWYDGFQQSTLGMFTRLSQLPLPAGAEEEKSEDGEAAGSGSEEGKKEATEEEEEEGKAADASDVDVSVAADDASASPEPPKTAMQKLVMGPWGHLIPFAQKSVQLEPVGEVDMHCHLDILGLELRWFEYHLKGVDNGMDTEPAVALFRSGHCRWREEVEWPLARAVRNRWLLGAADGSTARTAAGGGVLLRAGSADAELSWPEAAGDWVDSCSFDYDPRDPCPTVGGAILDGAGAFDQSAVEAREDVLVYTAAPLEEALEVTGEVTAVLAVSSDARDTDFTAKLVDVHPDGKAYNIADGILRMRFRDGADRPAPMEAGEVYTVRIALWATSHVFLAGHCLRLEVSSSSFPRYDRNANTFAPLFSDREEDLVVAHNVVHCTADAASWLELPVVAGA
eukprot:PLAT3355.31.p1 GENE.PLAT3355.31~~PLAT3355.31.p1  ORF type:complete len:693 (+),score=266.79 PLAT3355.31:96-2081(+)